jgi:hypothetical protein
LCEEDVAPFRQFLLTIPNLQTTIAPNLGSRAGLHSKDRHGMTQSLQLLRDREGVALAAPQPEVVCADDDLHLV